MTVSATIEERRELLLRMYEESRCHARHYETVRGTFVSFTLAAAVAISGLIASGGLNRKNWPLAVVLVVIGILMAPFYQLLFQAHQ